eukprot:4979144-Amphidinium_carterae.2
MRHAPKLVRGCHHKIQRKVIGMWSHTVKALEQQVHVNRPRISTEASPVHSRVYGRFCAVPFASLTWGKENVCYLLQELRRSRVEDAKASRTLAVTRTFGNEGESMAL